MRIEFTFIPDPTDDIHVILEDNVLIVQREWKIGEHVNKDDIARILLTSELQVGLLTKRGIE